MMSDGVLVIEFDGIIRLHNHAAEQLLALPESSLKNRTIAWIMTQTEKNDQLFECVLAAVHTKQRIVKTVPYFCNHQTTYAEQFDDLTMLSLEYKGTEQ